jgi:hypothetical protein
MVNNLLHWNGQEFIWGSLDHPNRPFISPTWCLAALCSIWQSCCSPLLLFHASDPGMF